MSNELISALENRVTNAVETIEDLRTEIRVLREERQHLEDKLRQLLQKIEGVENVAPIDDQTQTPSETSDNGPIAFGQPGMNMGSNSTEY